MTFNKLFAKGFEDYLKFGILVGFSLLILKLILNGNIKYYVNLKLLPFIAISAIFLIIIASVLFIKTNTIKESNSRLSYLLFIIPLFMGYFVSPKTISQADLQITGGQNQIISSNDNSNEDTDNSTTNENEPISKPSKMVFQDDNFLILLDSLYSEMNIYKDCEIEIIGKIYKESSMKSNEFVIARPMMSCCAADTSLVGLFCVNNTEIKVSKDVWAKIEGKISIINGKKGKMPGIEVQKVTLIDKPKNEFVYP